MRLPVAALGVALTSPVWAHTRPKAAVSRTPSEATPSSASLSRLPVMPEGPSPYRILDFDWHDERRLRPVPTRLYLPRGAHADAPVPMVAFTHGMGGVASGYRYLGTHLAAQGVACLHLQHLGGVPPLSALSLRPGLPDRQLQSARQAEAVALAQDVSHALDRIFSGPFGDIIDAGSCFAAGHAWGAKAPLLLAGAQPEGERQAAGLHDARIRAAILLSAPALDGLLPIQEVLAAVAVPSLHVTATRDITRMPGRTLTVRDRLSLFDHMPSRSKVLAVFDGGSSGVFTDQALTSGPDTNLRIKQATQDLVTAFVYEQLGSAEDDMGQWRRRHGDLLARFERQG